MPAALNDLRVAAASEAAEPDHCPDCGHDHRPDEPCELVPTDATPAEDDPSLYPQEAA